MSKLSTLQIFVIDGTVEETTKYVRCHRNKKKLIRSIFRVRVLPHDVCEIFWLNI